MNLQCHLSSNRVSCADDLGKVSKLDLYRLIHSFRGEFPDWLHVEDRVLEIPPELFQRILRYRCNDGRTLRTILTVDEQTWTGSNLISKLMETVIPHLDLSGLTDQIINMYDIDPSRPITLMLRSSIQDRQCSENRYEGRYESLQFHLSPDRLKLLDFYHQLLKFMRVNLQKNPRCKLGAFIVPAMRTSCTAHVYGNYQGHLIIKVVSNPGGIPGVGVVDLSAPTQATWIGWPLTITEEQRAELLYYIMETNRLMSSILKAPVHFELGVRLANDRSLERVRLATPGCFFYQVRQLGPLLRSSYFKLGPPIKSTIYQSLLSGVSQLPRKGKCGRLVHFPSEPSSYQAVLEMARMFPNDMLLLTSVDGGKLFDCQDLRSWPTGVALVEPVAASALHLVNESYCAIHTLGITEIIEFDNHGRYRISTHRYRAEFNGLEFRLTRIKD